MKTSALSPRLVAPVVALILLVAGCAGGAAQMARPQAAQVAPPLESYVLPDATVVLHVQVAELEGLPAFQALLQNVERFDALADTPLAELTERCELDWREAVDELVVSGSIADEDALLVASSSAPAELVQCVRRLADDAEPKRLWGLQAIEFGDGEVAVAREGRIFVGPTQRVKDALEAPPTRTGASDALRRLEGSSDSVLRLLLAGLPEVPFQSLGMALDGDDAHFRLRLALQSHDTEQADRVNDMLRDVQRGGLTQLPADSSDPAIRVLAAVLPTVEVKRTVDRKVLVDLIVEGDGPRQAMALSGFVSFSRGVVSGFQKRALAMAAQARVQDLAARVAAYAEAHRRGYHRFPTLPRSAPQTPAVVPQGEAAEVSAEDWDHETWQALEFALTGEEFYSYAVKVSASRRVATVTATGDLDGDGEQSHFELAVRIEPNGDVAVDPMVETRNLIE